MALAIQPLAEAFAGEVSGIDCSKPLSPESVTDQALALVHVRYCWEKPTKPLGRDFGKL